MTHNLTDKPSVVTTPFRQVINKAGEISSTVEDTSTWTPLENGLNIKDGKLALSTSTSTTVTNAQTLYPQLWANSPASWQSGSDLVIPATGGQNVTEWIDATTEMNLDAKAPTGTGLSVTQNNFSYYRYRGNGKSVDIEFRWNTTTSGSTTDDIKFLIPDGLEFGFEGLDIQNTIQSNAGTATTFKLQHNLFVDTDFITTTVSGSTTGASLLNLGGSAPLEGQDIIAAAQVYMKANIKIDQDLSGQTPIIYLFDNIASNAIGLPDATATVKGLVRNQEGVVNCVVNGFSDITDVDIKYTMTENQVTLQIPQILGTSNSTAFNITLPPSLAKSGSGNNEYFPLIRQEDNGTLQSYEGRIGVTNAGLIDFRSSSGGSLWAASNGKGLAVQHTITYIKD